jgi:hypothetical protein
VESFVFVAVLFAGACHAGWNALIKVGLDPLSTTTLIAIGAAAVSLVCLPFASMPASQAWPWLVASAIIQTRHAADISLEIAKSLSSGTAEVLEAINRLFEFAARHETIENLSNLKQNPIAQRRPHAAS